MPEGVAARPLDDDLVFSEGILRSRGISRCSAAPIAKLARLGEPQFSRWRYAEPDSKSRKPEVDTWKLPFSVAPKRFKKTALTDEELERLSSILVERKGKHSKGH